MIRYPWPSTFFLVCAAIAAPVFAQTQPDVLKGPEVQDRAVPGTVGSFAGTPETGKFRQREVRPAIFMQALMSALGPDAPESVRANDEQREQLRTLGSEFRQKVQAYMAEHRGELDQLRTGPGAARRGKNKGASSDTGKDATSAKDSMSVTAATEPMSEDALAKAKALREGMPSASDLYTKVWTVLSADQRAAVETKLDEYQHEQAEKEGRDYVKRRIQKAQPVPGLAPGLEKSKGKFGAGRLGSTDTATDSRLPAEFRERLFRALQSMTPDEREKLLERLEQRLKDRQGAAPAPDTNTPRAKREKGAKRLKTPASSDDSSTSTAPRPE